MTSVKTNSAIVLAIVVALVVVGAFAVRSDAQPSSVTIQTQATATTTLAYMTAGTGTTTYQIDSPTFSSGKVASMQNIDSASMLILVVGTTSPVKLDFQVQVSNNGLDWYPLVLATSSASQGGGQIYVTAPTASSTVYEYNVGIVGTTTTQFTLPIVAAQHERIVFTDPVGGGALGFYTEYDLKKLPSTP